MIKDRIYGLIVIAIHLMISMAGYLELENWMYGVEPLFWARFTFLLVMTASLYFIVVGVIKEKSAEHGISVVPDRLNLAFSLSLPVVLFSIVDIKVLWYLYIVLWVIGICFVDMTIEHWVKKSLGKVTEFKISPQYMKKWIVVAFMHVMTSIVMYKCLQYLLWDDDERGTFIMANMGVSAVIALSLYVFSIGIVQRTIADRKHLIIKNQIWLGLACFSTVFGSHNMLLDYMRWMMDYWFYVITFAYYMAVTMSWTYAGMCYSVEDPSKEKQE